MICVAKKFTRFLLHYIKNRTILSNGGLLLLYLLNSELRCMKICMFSISFILDINRMQWKTQFALLYLLNDDMCRQEIYTFSTALYKESNDLIEWRTPSFVLTKQ